jgi:hypothetical protein
MFATSFSDLLGTSHYRELAGSSQTFRYSIFPMPPPQFISRTFNLSRNPIKTNQNNPLEPFITSILKLMNTLTPNVLVTNFSAMENSKATMSSLFKIKASCIPPESFQLK